MQGVWVKVINIMSVKENEYCNTLFNWFKCDADYFMKFLL